MATITGRIIDRNGGAAAGLRVEVWTWPGKRAHRSALMAGMHQHFFVGVAEPLEIQPGDWLVAYIYLDPANPPREVMLQWNHNGWEHRACWGDDLIDYWGAPGTESRHLMGPLPPAGQWVRLEVRASQVGLEGLAIHGMAFTLFDGRAAWDHAGKAPQPGQPPEEDVVWVEDMVPPGAVEHGENEGWEWITADPAPFSGVDSVHLADAVTLDGGHFELIADDALLADLFQNRPAMISFRVLQGDAVLAGAEDTAVWRADNPSDVEIEVDVPPVVPQLSEYERLRVQVDPLIGEQELAEMTRDQARQFAESHGVVVTHLVDLWSAIRLSGESDLPVEMFYGLLRRDLPRDLDRLLSRPLDELRAALEAAIAHNTIPARLSDALPDLMHRLSRLKTEHTPVAELAEISQVALPPELEAFLADKRIRTLADLRGSGGIGQLRELPVSPDAPTVRLLEAHAKLSTLPTDPPANAHLIALGYPSPVAIVGHTHSEFIASAAGALGVAQAGQIYQAAQAQTALFKNVLASLRADEANDYTYTPTAPRRACECKDCRSAISPGAYLADLMDYTLKHMKRGFDHIASGSRPAVCSPEPGRLDVFLRGKDNALWHIWYQNHWSNWESLGGELSSDPAAVSWGSGRIDVFGRGTDDALWHKWFDGAWGQAAWSEWESLSGVFNSGPAVSSWSVGRLDVFMQGDDDALWHIGYDGAWSNWESLGGVLSSAPAAVSWDKGRIDVFGRGTDNALWHKWFDGAWSNWESLYGVLKSAPTVSSWSPGHLDVFMQGIDDALWHIGYGGAWSNWESLGGVLTSGPAAVSWGNGRIDVFVRGTDDALWHKWYEGVWSNWASVSAIDIDFLSRNFHQPFGDLPISCEAADTQVRQVRLCIEVLWRYLSAMGGPILGYESPLLVRGKAEFLLQAYRILLARMGTSYDELRLIRSATMDEQRALADRLGIEPLIDGVNNLSALFLAPELITPAKLEELFGLVDTDPRRRDPLVAGQQSKMQVWRLRHLRTLWHGQDWPSDVYSVGKLPVIDPDVVTPDDFRHPVDKEIAGLPDQPFDLWIRRRDWVDARLAAFTGLVKNARGQQMPDLEAMLQAMYQNVAYESTSLAAWTQPPLTDLRALLIDLRGSDKQAALTAAETIQTNLLLPVEAFAHLMDIREKATRWEKRQSDEAVTMAEWSEVISILVQAQKTAFFESWVAEETQWQAANGRVLFSPQHFWPPLREPQGGDWPVVLPGPHVDPELVRLNDLWEPAVRDHVQRPADPARDRALQLWQARQQELTKVRNALENEYETNGFEAMLRQALGDPNPGDALPQDLDDLKKKLDGGDAKEVERATSDIENNLHMSVQDFNQLLLVRLKVSNNRPLTRVDTNAVYTILTTAEKRKRHYARWMNEENPPRRPLRYWQAFKARLPLWRAPVEQRQAWRQALSLRSQPPNIDPDVIGAGHLREQTGVAYSLWESRTEGMADQIADLGTNPKTLAGLDTMLEAVVGIGEAALGALAKQRDQGEGIAAQLAQLNLLTDAFIYLARVRAVLANNQPVLDEEWVCVYSILAQVWKRRQFAHWRAEEEKASIILSQDTFEIPEIQAATFPPPPPPELPAWRATWRDRQAWEDALRARIELEESVLQDLRQAVSETEEAALPRLRDALVAATAASGKDPSEKARWITARLLIDAQMEGCQMTTRIAQAIETLLNLLWSARLGQLDDLGEKLTLDAPNFDGEWRWIGSYATWRAAMFVFMYPDNLLLPSLKRQQTPAFRQLVNNLRSGRQLTPQRARQAVQQFTAYFRDICALDLQATVNAPLRLVNAEGVESREAKMFLFAKSGESDKIYWCRRDSHTRFSAVTQTFWEEIPNLVAVRNLIGAVEYRISEQERFILLFARLRDGRNSKLVFSRYDLERGGEFGDPQELKLPNNATDFASAALFVSPAPYALPYLVITLLDNRSYTRRMNGAAQDWESADFQPVTYTVKFAEWQNVELNVSEKCTSEFDSQKAADWIRAAHNFARGQGFAAGFPNFHKSGKDCGVIKLTADAVSVTQADAESVGRSEPNTIQGLVDRFKNVHRFVKGTFPGLYVTGFPTFDDQGNQYTIAMIKSEAATLVAESLPDILPDACDFAQQFVRLDSRKDTLGSYTGVFPTFVPLATSSQSAKWACYLKPGQGQQRQLGTTIAPEIVSWYKPICTGLFSLAPFYTEADRTAVAAALAGLYTQSNAGAPQSILDYLDEAFYCVPMMIALQLQKAGEYTAALDYFRTVYDFTAAEGARKVFYGLRQEEKLPPDLPQRAANWLLDPLNPHAIAATRRNTYTRYTLLSLIRCILHYADAEFTRDTAESVPRARILYTTALELMETDELKQKVGKCEALIGSIDIEVDYLRWVPIEWRPVWNGLVRRLRNITDATRLAPAVQQIKAAMAETKPWPQFFAQISQVVTQAEEAAPPQSLTTLVQNRSLQVEANYTALLAQPALAEAAARVGALAVAGNGGGFASSDTLSGAFLPTITYDFCVPPNPVLKALRLRAELNLYKIRTCRNIAGMERQLEPYTAPVDTVSGLPVIGAGGQLVLPGTTVLRPTPYRYAVLIERAKHLVGLAQQVEAAFLSALEKRDAEAYTMLKARQDIRLASAGVRLQELRVKEAEDSVELAELQKQRSQIQCDYYTELLDEGWTTWEQLAIGLMYGTMGLQIAASLSSLLASGFYLRAVVAGKLPAERLSSLGASFSAIASSQSSLASATSTMASIFATYAGYERRAQEWEFQKKLAQHDLLIGDQQITIAQDKVRLVGQERVIAEMQTEHAEATADFLANKFTNTDLYEWMTGVLEGVYGYFLQQATSMTQLASHQLAFERHEVPPPFIQADYWEAPSEEMSGDATPGPDRRGLTGSARLLRDIYQLDQYAFLTNERKLQLSKTISLARMAPAEFQRFRETGVIKFATPMEIFDRDFPGHYLRLIHKVRVSVVALIPPTQGIRATLTAHGLSRVVIRGDIFQTVPVRREPQTIALSSPANATGLFELDPQSDMLAPFETMGVATSWEFRMPKAANPFDYSTLADILVTIEYTALDDLGYRPQVIQALPTRLSASQPFSMRHHFPDNWYDLHNSEMLEEEQRMIVRFKTVRGDFPPNLEGLQMQRVALYFAGRGRAGIPQTALYYTEQGGSGRVGGSAQTNDGLASWTAMSPRSPVGEWELALPDTEDMRNRFKNKEFDDILFVIIYSGRLPEWPE